MSNGRGGGFINGSRTTLKFKTMTGKYLSLSNIFIILQKTFYYGVFEYPDGIGKLVYGEAYAAHHKRTL